MSAAARPRNKAFLSYSQKDRRIGEWFHRKLEGFRIDADLVGRVTSAGPVPKSVHPIFRDRSDLAAGHSLTGPIRAELANSDWLIVLCSPEAAKSDYVNEEIRIFRSLGRAERIIAVIVAGEPGHPEHECFPPALRVCRPQPMQPAAASNLRLAAPAGTRPSGTGTAGRKSSRVAPPALLRPRSQEQTAGHRLLRSRMRVAAPMPLRRPAAPARTSGIQLVPAFRASRRVEARDEPLAADAREHGDGRDMALLKVVAGLLGLGLDEIVRRERQRQRREKRMWAAIAASMLLLAVGAGVLGTIAWREAERNGRLLETNEKFLDKSLKRATRLVERAVRSSRERGVPVRESIGFLQEAAGLFDDMSSHAADMTRYGRPSDDLQHQKALMLLSHADIYSELGETAARLDYSRQAVELLDKLRGGQEPVRILMDRAIAHARWGTALQVENRRVEATQRYDAARGLLLDARRSVDGEPARQREIDIELAALLRRRAQISWSTGARAEVEAAHSEGRSILEGVLRDDPSHIDAKAVLADFLEDIAGQYWAQYPPAQVEAWARKLQDLRRELLAASPDDSRRKTAFAQTYITTGEVNFRKGRPDVALEEYRKGYNLFRERLDRDPGNASLKSGAAWLLIKIGDANCLNKYDLRECEANYRDSEKHYAELVKTDPTNIAMRYRWSTAHRGIGIALRVGGERIEEAIKHYEINERILEDIIRDDPKRLNDRRDLALIQGRIGGALEQLGRREEALARYRKGLDMRLELHGRDPENVLWLRDVARAYDTIANVQLRLQRPDQALETLLRQLAAHEKLVRKTVGNVADRDGFAHTVEKAAQVAWSIGDADKALALLHDALATVAEFRDLSPDKTEWDDARHKIEAQLASLRKPPQASTIRLAEPYHFP